MIQSAYQIIIAITLFTNISFAQGVFCNPSEFCFQEVVIVDSTFSDLMLFNRAENYLFERKNHKNSDFEKKSVEGSFNFWVYTGKGVLQKKHGLITYDLFIETKNGKYKYVAKNFIFNYYKLDRYEKFNPTGQTKKLEDTKAPGWQKVWSRHKISAEQNLLSEVEKLKKHMESQLDKKKDEKKLNPKTDW
ncbi:MAG: DUF4468 domain-containing protein [Cytophagales bacterium]